MKDDHLVQSLVDRFVECNREWEHCEEPERSSELIVKGIDCLRTIQERTGSAIAVLRPMLDHPLPVVRVAAATFLAHVEPERCREILNDLAAKQRGYVRMSASGALISLDSGSLAPPFELK